MIKAQCHELDTFIEQMGLVAEAEGLSRIAGRIMGVMVLESGPLSFSEIAERLDVSRASVSTNTRFLERIGVIDRLTVKGSRQDHFRLARSPYARLLEGSVARMKKAESVAANAKNALSPEDNERRQRLDELGAFYATLAQTFEELVARFDQQR
jgi:DNA-binding transcriptional regulator GbsR (MarR family)